MSAASIILSTRSRPQRVIPAQAARVCLIGGLSADRNPSKAAAAAAPPASQNSVYAAAASEVKSDFVHMSCLRLPSRPCFLRVNLQPGPLPQFGIKFRKGWHAEEGQETQVRVNSEWKSCLLA